MLQQSSAVETEETGRMMQAFKLLVVAQDLDMTVDESRTMVAELLGLTDAEICQVEREGIGRGWPPL
jgi:hypothetical protein